jgi:hypothetical protein
MKLSELQKLVREVLSEMEDEDLDEITTTGSVAGYNTPNAFKKTDGKNVDDEPDSSYVKRINTGTGYTQVNESVKQGKRYGSWSVTQYDPIKYDDLGSVSGGLIKLVNQETADTLLIQHDNALRGSKWWVSTNGRKVQDQKPEVVIQKAIKLNEGTNRYHQLRKSEGTPNQKIGVGIRELRQQLSEMEKFVTWYGKIKNESGLDSADYWKRTQRHLTKIRERIDKLSQKIRDLSV